MNVSKVYSFDKNKTAPWHVIDLYGYILCHVGFDNWPASQLVLIVSRSDSLGNSTSQGRPEDVPKNVLRSSGRPYIVLYVTPKDISAAGRPWDVIRRQFNHNP